MTPWGQVTCWRSQSMAEHVRGASRRCAAGGWRWCATGRSGVIPRARAVTSSSAEAYPASTACSAGGQPGGGRACRARGSVIATSAVLAGVVAHADDQVRASLRLPSRPGHLAGLGEVDLVAQPALAAFFAVAGIGVIRRDDPGSARREALLGGFPALPPPPARSGRYCCTQIRRSVSTAGSSRSHDGAPGARTASSSTVPSAPVLAGQVFAFRLAGRQPHPVDPLPVDLLPRRADHPGQPSRRRGGQGLQRRPDRFPGQLQPVQVPDPPQLPAWNQFAPSPPAFTRPSFFQPLQQQVKDRRATNPMITNLAWGWAGVGGGGGAWGWGRSGTGAKARAEVAHGAGVALGRGRRRTRNGGGGFAF